MDTTQTLMVGVRPAKCHRGATNWLGRGMTRLRMRDATAAAFMLLP